MRIKYLNLVKSSCFLLITTVLSVSVAYAFLPSGDSDFYYELGGAAPISNSIFEGQANASVSLQSQFDVGLNCSGKNGFSFNFAQSVIAEFAHVPLGGKGLSRGRIEGAFKSAVGAIQNLGVSGSLNVGANILVSLSLQKLNPGLYDTIMSGIAKVEDLISKAENACELVKEQLTKDGGVVDKMQKYARSKGWIDATTAPSAPSNSSNSSSATGDILEIADTIDKDGGDNGVLSFGGETKGNSANNPLYMNQDAVLAGYNMIQNRAINDLSSPTLGPVSTRPVLLKHFPTPQSARDFVNTVIGDKELTTCNGCEPIKSSPGKGLSYVYNQEVDNYRQGFADILDGSVAATAENLAAISAPPQVYITPKLVEMMKSDPDGPYVAGKIASEIAMITTLQKALTLRRMLYTAKKEPNAESSGFLKEGVEEAIKDLDEEISLMKTEMEINNMMASSTASKYMNHYKNKYNKSPLRTSTPPVTLDNGVAQ